MRADAGSVRAGAPGPGAAAAAIRPARRQAALLGEAMTRSRFDLTYSVPWNLGLIFVGSVLFSLGAKAIVAPHGFVSGGVFGVALLAHYSTGLASPGVLYFLLNIPLFALAWFFISRRFLYYSLWAMVVSSVAFEVIQADFGIRDPLHAAIAAGVVCGAGVGMVLRSLGSNGGLDVVAVMLFQRYNLGIGKFYFLFNLGLFSMTLAALDVDLVIDSLIMVFITSVVMEYFLALFSQRKVVYIISDASERICQRLRDELSLGGTFIQGRGAYTGSPKDILMTVVNNVQLKRLEEVVFTTDEHALFIAENTFSVIGSSFSRRKIY